MKPPDPQRHFHLLWIAEAALTAPLPPHIEEYTDHIGYPYYYDTKTDTCTRENVCFTWEFGVFERFYIGKWCFYVGKWCFWVFLHKKMVLLHRKMVFFWCFYTGK
jgi:hypothetical protein